MRTALVFLSLFVPALSLAGTSCVCEGTASIFSQAAQYLEVRMDTAPQCDGNACGFTAGSVHRLYYSQHTIRGRTAQSYLSGSGRDLARERAGYPFRYRFTLSRKDGRTETVWQVLPR